MGLGNCVIVQTGPMEEKEIWEAVKSLGLEMARQNLESHVDNQNELGMVEAVKQPR